MRIAFEDTDRPSRVAQAIRRHLADRGVRLPATASRDIVGRMFGYAGWSDLAKAPRGGAFLPDHLVGEEERAARREQCRQALIAYGLADDLADMTVAAVAPTGRPDAPSLDALDFLSDPPAFMRRMRGADPAAFLAHPGGARIVRAVQAAALDDPYWGLRGASRMGLPGDEWIVGTMDALRANAGHPQWASLVLVCLGMAGITMSHEHPYAGDLGALVSDAVSRGDAGRLADLMRDAAPQAILSLVTHVEDVIVAQVGRRSPHRASMLTTTLFVASERRPWQAASPFDLRRPETGCREWSLEALNNFGFYPAEAPDSVAVRIMDGAGRGTDIGWPVAFGPDRRDDVVLIGRPGQDPELAAAVRVWADPAIGAFRVDVEGPGRIQEGGDESAWEGMVNFLKAVVLSRLDMDLRSWSRIVPPGGSLRLLVSPARDGADGRFVRDLVRTIGDRHEIYQAQVADLGFDLVVEAAHRSGRPAPLPSLHVAEIPATARSGWEAFENAYTRIAAEGTTTLLFQLRDGGFAIADGGGLTLSGRSPAVDEALADLAAPEVEHAIRAVVVEAGLGSDACLLKTIDIVAVLSDAVMNDRDWSNRIEACLFSEVPPTPGHRMRMHAQFWSAFGDELEAIQAARAAEGVGRFLPVASAARH